MKQQVIRFLSLHFILLCSGCAGIQLVEDRKDFQQPHIVKDYSYTVNVPFVHYVATPVDMDSFCNGQQWKDVEVTPTVLGELLSVVTLGILEPQRVEATCAKNG
jgi:hypothetical protein